MNARVEYVSRCTVDWALLVEHEEGLRDERAEADGREEWHEIGERVEYVPRPQVQPHAQQRPPPAEVLTRVLRQPVLRVAVLVVLHAHMCERL